MGGIGDNGLERGRMPLPRALRLFFRALSRAAPRKSPVCFAAQRATHLQRRTAAVLTEIRPQVHRDFAAWERALVEPVEVGCRCRDAHKEQESVESAFEGDGCSVSDQRSSTSESLE